MTRRIWKLPYIKSILVKKGQPVWYLVLSPVKKNIKDVRSSLLFLSEEVAQTYIKNLNERFTKKIGIEHLLEKVEAGQDFSVYAVAFITKDGTESTRVGSGWLYETFEGAKSSPEVRSAIKYVKDHLVNKDDLARIENYDYLNPIEVEIQ